MPNIHAKPVPNRKMPTHINGNVQIMNHALFSVGGNIAPTNIHKQVTTKTNNIFIFLINICGTCYDIITTSFG